MEGFAVLKRIDDEWAREVAPKGDSVVIVLNRGSATIHKVGIDVTAITANASNPSAPPLATIMFAIGKPPQLAPKAAGGYGGSRNELLAEDVGPFEGL